MLISAMDYRHLSPNLIAQPLRSLEIGPKTIRSRDGCQATRQPIVENNTHRRLRRMLRIEFQIRPAGISSKLFDLEEQIRSIEVDNALPATSERIFLFLTVQFDDDISEEVIAGQLPNTKVVDTTKAEVNQHTY